GREKRHAALRESGFAALAPVEQLGDAEIQALDLRPGRRLRDEDVGWLQIAMHDEIAVGVLHGKTNLLEEMQALIDRQSLRVAVLCDRHALDVLHDEVGQTIFRHACVEQAGNAGMLEASENSPFSEEPLELGAGRETAVAHHLERSALTHILPLDQVYGAHPALPDFPQDAVRPDLAADQRRRSGLIEQTRKQLVGIRGDEMGEQAEHLATKRGIIATRVSEKFIALLRLELHGGAEERLGTSGSCVPVHVSSPHAARAGATPLQTSI